MPRILSAIVLVAVTALLCGAQTTSDASRSEQRFSIDYPDTDTRVLLRAIGDRFELNLVIPSSLQGVTSLKLHNVTWKQALEVVLEPMGYTYRVEGDIVKVVPLDAGVTPSVMSKQGEWSLLTDGPWYVIAVVCLFVLVLISCHVALSIGVLRDVLPERTRFAPRFVWAFLVLVGGVIPLVGYWIIHHSILSRTAQGPDVASPPTTPAVTPPAEPTARQS